MRVIAHVDMDAFFASIEQRDNPRLKGKPVIVGGLGGRGVVSTCSYEARKDGIHSAMPMSKAKKLCPQGVFLPSSMKRYHDVSRQIFSVFDSFTPIVEAASVDEAYLDLTGTTHFYGSLAELGGKLQASIYLAVSLTASVGIAPNKFLAKLASEWHKPCGLTIVQPRAVDDFLRALPVDKLWGVGPATCEKLKAYGFATAGDIALAPPEKLATLFGRQGKVLWELASGHDTRPVQADREVKSMGQEQTFPKDLSAPEAKAHLARLAAKVGGRLRAEGLHACTITLKARYGDFRTLTRSRTLSAPTQNDDLIFTTAWELLERLPIKSSFRLLGVTASNLVTSRQLSLFERPRQDKLLAAMDKLKEKYGAGVIVRGREIGG